jgi:hypothetical protein
MVGKKYIYVLVPLESNLKFISKSSGSYLVTMMAGKMITSILLSESKYFINQLIHNTVALKEY